jgi:ABC-type bacteriocin/lantibiotic exporter with double-glycine peptidase domain
MNRPSDGEPQAANRPTTGRIRVDGYDLSRLWLPSLRRQVGVVPQSSFLFRGTIRDNLA